MTGIQIVHVHVATVLSRSYLTTTTKNDKKWFALRATRLQHKSPNAGINKEDFVDSVAPELDRLDQ